MAISSNDQAKDCLIARSTEFFVDAKAIMDNKQYCVYILTYSRHTVFYTGVTNNLEHRVLEHKSKTGSSFTRRYNVDQLVYFECGDDVNNAIAREKQIKAGSRQDKIDLINSINPEWKDLSKVFWPID